MRPASALLLVCLSLAGACGRFGYELPADDGDGDAPDDGDGGTAGAGGSGTSGTTGAGGSVTSGSPGAGTSGTSLAGSTSDGGSDGGGLGAETPLGSPGGDAHVPRLVIADGELLLIWDDLVGGRPQLFGARVSTTGVPLAAPIPLTQSSGSAGYAAVAWTGAGAAVVWEDTRDGNAEIYAARFSPALARIGDDLRLSTTPKETFNPEIAWNGSELAVAWDDGGKVSSDLFLQRFAADLVPQGGLVPVSSAMGESVRASMVWRGSEWALAWEDDTAGGVMSMWFARVSVAGVLPEAPRRETAGAGAALRASLVASDAGFGLAWEDRRSGAYAITFARLDAAGVKQGNEVVVSTAGGDARQASLVWNGSVYGVAWTQSGEVQLAELAADGTPIAPPRAVAGIGAGDAARPSLVWLGDRWALAWEDNRLGPWDIFVTVLP